MTLYRSSCMIYRCHTIWKLSSYTSFFKGNFMRACCSLQNIHLQNICPILTRAALGMVLMILALCCYGALEAASYYQSRSSHWLNSTCFLRLAKYDSDSAFSFEYGWFTGLQGSLCLIIAGFCCIYKLYKPMQKSYMEIHQEPSDMSKYWDNFHKL